MFRYILKVSAYYQHSDHLVRGLSKFLEFLVERSFVNLEVAGKTMRHTRTIIGPFSVFPNSYKLFSYYEVCFSHNIIRCRSDIIHLYRMRGCLFSPYIQQVFLNDV
jgi:hypothetical protein